MARYNAGFHYNSSARYNQQAGRQLTLDSIIDDRVLSGQQPVRVYEVLRATLAILAGKDVGAQPGSTAITFYAPDGTTRRVTAVLDGTGNRSSTDIRPD